MVAISVSPVEVMKSSKTIAVVGASKNPEKEAHTVPLYLKGHGYRIVPVNPTSAKIFGERSYASLTVLPEDVWKSVDAVEVFRPSEELPQVALQLVEMKKRYGHAAFFWAQQGLESKEAERILQENGIPYVMNACMRTVHRIDLPRAT